ncbi:LADA_0D08724g1_1 [Lachancea dasiensis]|uniref:LADA_0D08724g1_1 n=1 Tax=Lachancea dasiensis TaxID=1072105 RepID=A0A1G4J762_9SACH|nr:LADA_0D08724g1_1 [Lachancea dasiensis]
MNTPPMTAEQQLTPKMSPIMLHLDDNLPSLAGSSFKHLDDNSSQGYSAMYRTSLSKLTERGRQGRGRTVDPKTPTKLLRSNSPIRAMLSNGHTTAPKMLKPEYMSMSRLFNSTRSQTAAPAATPSMILSSSKLIFKHQPQEPLQHQGQQEPERQQECASQPGEEKQQPLSSLDQHREARQAVQRQPQPPPVKPSVSVAPTPQKCTQSQKHVMHSRQHSDTSSTLSTATACHTEEANDSQAKTSHRPNLIPDLVPEMKLVEHPSKSRNYKFPSATSTASSSSTLDIKEYPENLSFEVPTSERDEFVLATQSKRSSYISSVGSSNDDELNGWFAQYADDRQMSTLNLSDAQTQRQQIDALRERTFQTEHFSLRAKQMELQIAELMLQNEQLRHSMTAHRTVQDKCMFDALHDVHREKENTHREMNRKMKQLEKQLEYYRKIVKKLTAPVNTPPLASRPRIPLVDAVALEELAEVNSSSGDDTENDDDNSNDNNNDTKLAQTTTITKPYNDESSQQLLESPRKRLAGIKLGLTFET